MQFLRAFVLSAVFAFAQVDDRNFSGSWKLDQSASQIGRMPATPLDSMKVNHEGAALTCVTSDARTACSHRTDGSESRTGVGDSTVSSRTKWEGRALLISSLVSGAENYSISERWTLSTDGATLRIRRQWTGPRGEVESMLVYRRDGSLTARNGAAEAADPVPAQPRPMPYIVEAGTKVPLKIINSVSTKNSAEGDRVYLQTAFPIMARGKVVIPPGSYVAGTLTNVTRPGRMKGKGEMFLRFDTLTLPNGVTRDFRARPGGMDGDTDAKVDRDEGGIKGEGNKGGDARKVGEATAAGASVGAIAGSVAGRSGMGLGVGAGAGAAAGLVGVLLSRGPDVVLRQGTTIEMVLDRELTFELSELVSGSQAP
ncbi:MAG TPA: hypothetical protein VES20_19370 [Bryobacteraceae bacterium]|nr:hypothetical protein [Bryobacteraceae bacterium]